MTNTTGCSGTPEVRRRDTSLVAFREQVDEQLADKVCVPVEGDALSTLTLHMARSAPRSGRASVGRTSSGARLPDHVG